MATNLHKWSFMACALLIGSTSGNALAINSLALPIERYRLDNGLTVILQPDHTTPLVAVNLWVGNGLSDELPGYSGFAHLFEHLFLQASEHIDKKTNDTLISSIGGRQDGTTSGERTSYYALVPSWCLETVLWLRSDQFGFLLGSLSTDRLELQKQDVLNERRQRYENAPYGGATLRLWEMLFSVQHPYHGLVIGYPDQIKRMTMKDVVSFYRSNYSPSNASLVITGDFDGNEARSLIKKYFGSISGPPPMIHRPAQQSIPQAELQETLHDRVTASKIFSAWILPPPFSREDAALGLLLDTLGDDDSGALARRLRHELHLAESASCWRWSGSLASVMVCEAAANPGVSLAALKSAFDAVIREASERGPDANQLHARKAQRRLWLLHKMENLLDRAEFINRYNRFTNDPAFFARDFERYEHVDAADLRRVTQRWLPLDHRAVIFVEPVPAK